VSQKKIKLDDRFPGRDFVMEITGRQGLLRGRAYLANGTLYKVIVVGAKEFAESSEADQVLDSFKLKR